MVAVVGKRKPRPKPRVFDGDKLREQRKAKDLTQAHLAEQIDAHEVDISRYESGTVEPTLAVAVRLAKALGIEVGELLRDE